MPRRPPVPVSLVPAVTSCVLGVTFILALSLTPAWAESRRTQEVTKRFPNVRGVVRFENIAGSVTVGKAEGDATTVKAVIHAIGDTDQEAKELLDLLKLSFSEKGGDLHIDARYPLDRYDTYHYPEFDHSGSSTSTSSEDGQKVVVTTRKTRDAVPLWVDLELRVEPGVGVQIKEMAGDIDVSGVEGPVKVENGWGDMTITGVKGDLLADTGSGDVSVRGHRGKSVVDTGSGQVVVEDVNGAVDAETGSGDIQVLKVMGSVRVETGSGDVELSDVKGAISIETGSGDTRISSAEAEEVKVDTGSGTISIDSPALFRDPGAAVARFDTGSGDVVLQVDDKVSMLLYFSSGSGRVRSPRALEGRIERVGREGEERRYRIGGDASHVTVGTGSGDVVLRLAGQ